MLFALIILFLSSDLRADTVRWACDSPPTTLGGACRHYGKKVLEMQGCVVQEAPGCNIVRDKARRTAQFTCLAKTQFCKMPDVKSDCSPGESKLHIKRKMPEYEAWDDDDSGYPLSVGMQEVLQESSAIENVNSFYVCLMPAAKAKRPAHRGAKQNAGGRR